VEENPISMTQGRLSDICIGKGEDSILIRVFFLALNENEESLAKAALET